LVVSSCNNRQSDQRKPNVIVILIDDLGYADIGCYGSAVNQTPEIDKLAKNGMLLTDYHANGPMCTPTRISLLTGLYPHRLGAYFETALDDMAHQNIGLPLAIPTVASIFKEADNYKTAMFGKWHLGYQPPFLPTSYGFEHFKGLLAGDGDHHTHINRSGKEDWWHDEQPVLESGYSVDLITDHSVAFIRNNQHQPFFLYVSHLAIHFPWQGPDDPGHRIAGNDYRQDKWGVIADRSDVSSYVKAMVEAVDQSVGKIIAELKALGLEENTLVVFTSDNGGYIEYPDKDGDFKHISDNGEFRGQKGQLYEGGHRVPFIASWPKKIPEGTKNNSLVMSMDLVPTLMHLAGISIPDDVSFDGIDVSTVLTANQEVESRTVFWKRGDQFSVRESGWKLVQAERGLTELYNLAHDPRERNNIIAQHPEMASEMMDQYAFWLMEMNTSAARWDTGK